MTAIVETQQTIERTVKFARDTKKKNVGTVKFAWDTNVTIKKGKVKFARDTNLTIKMKGQLE